MNVFPHDATPITDEERHDLERDALFGELTERNKLLRRERDAAQARIADLQLLALRAERGHTQLERGMAASVLVATLLRPKPEAEPPSWPCSACNENAVADEDTRCASCRAEDDPDFEETW